MSINQSNVLMVRSLLCMHKRAQLLCGHSFGTRQKHRAAAQQRALPELPLGPEAVLDIFWQGRGVSDSGQRAKLVECGLAAGRDGDLESSVHLGADEPVPGVNAFWQLESNPAYCRLIQALSSRILQLHSLLGSRADISVGQMVAREPRLVSAQLPDIASRLVAMRTAEGAQTLDIGKVVEEQPSLLLESRATKDSPEAWSFGLASDDDQQWQAQLASLQEYRVQHGDVHVGHRPSDPPELVRFARMQRAAHKAGRLQDSRAAALEEIGFVLDADAAEWDFMYRSLEEVQEAGRELSLGGSNDLLLMNWCSVQRIARRSSMLSQKRLELLDAIHFDWTGADPLS